MWIWRKMLKISCIQRVTNQEILNMTHEERNVINSIHQRQHNWIGHVIRHDGLLNRITEGGIVEKRGRRRKRQQMIDDIKDKEKYGNLKRTARTGRTCYYIADYYKKRQEEIDRLIDLSFSDLIIDCWIRRSTSYSALIQLE